MARNVPCGKDINLQILEAENSNRINQRTVPRHIIIKHLKLKQKKTFKVLRGEMTVPEVEKNSSDMPMFVIRCHRAVAHFSSAERKQLSTHTLYPGKISFRSLLYMAKWNSRNCLRTYKKKKTKHRTKKKTMHE